MSFINVKGPKRNKGQRLDWKKKLRRVSLLFIAVKRHKRVERSKDLV